MRRALIGILLATTASAAPHADKKPKPIDAKAVADKLDVWKDDLGQFYVVPHYGAFKGLDEIGSWVFYGDGKNMYQQRIIGSSQTDGATYEWSIWAPRVTTLQMASMAVRNNRLTVVCGVKDERALTQLKADEAKTFLARAAFFPALWQRQSRFLARDDDGVYYFVDELRDEFGGQGYRVFVGPKGAMKEQAMTNVVEDSGGFIFATKSGSLKIIADKKTDTAQWVKGGKKTELTTLVPGDNRYLIYRQLGVYGSIGTVCDDL